MAQSYSKRPSSNPSHDSLHIRGDPWDLPSVPTTMPDNRHAGAAWYNTWPSHFKEVECFQQQVEPILYKYGVDMVYTGHTHAYEVRSRPPKTHAGCGCTASQPCHTWK